MLAATFLKDTRSCITHQSVNLKGKVADIRNVKVVDSDEMFISLIGFIVVTMVIVGYLFVFVLVCVIVLSTNAVCANSYEENDEVLVLITNAVVCSMGGSNRSRIPDFIASFLLSLVCNADAGYYNVDIVRTSQILVEKALKVSLDQGERLDSISAYPILVSERSFIPKENQDISATQVDFMAVFLTYNVVPSMVVRTKMVPSEGCFNDFLSRRVTLGAIEDITY